MRQRQMAGFADCRRYKRSPLRTVVGQPIPTDHGSQFTSWTFSQKVRSTGLIQSIGSVGGAFDNADTECFRETMRIELLSRHRWTTRLKR
jgi:transposase InsO family protein